MGVPSRCSAPSTTPAHPQHPSPRESGQPLPSPGAPSAPWRGMADSPGISRDREGQKFGYHIPPGCPAWHWQPWPAENGRDKGYLWQSRAKSSWPCPTDPRGALASCPSAAPPQTQSSALPAPLLRSLTPTDEGPRAWPGSWRGRNSSISTSPEHSSPSPASPLFSLTPTSRMRAQRM